MVRKSTWRLRKKEWTNLRAVESDLSWYTNAVNARGIDASASECKSGGDVGVDGWVKKSQCDQTGTQSMNEPVYASAKEG